MGIPEVCNCATKICYGPISHNLKQNAESWSDKDYLGRLTWSNSKEITACTVRTDCYSSKHARQEPQDKETTQILHQRSPEQEQQKDAIRDNVYRTSSKVLYQTPVNTVFITISTIHTLATRKRNSPRTAGLVSSVPTPNQAHTNSNPKSQPQLKHQIASPSQFRRASSLMHPS